jgi:hypothetical protein
LQPFGREAELFGLRHRRQLFRTAKASTRKREYGKQQISGWLHAIPLVAPIWLGLITKWHPPISILPISGAREAICRLIGS